MAKARGHGGRYGVGGSPREQRHAPDARDVQAQDAQDVRNAQHEDPKLRRVLGFWQLTGIALGGIIGSGWLLTPQYAAQQAGPLAVATWVVAGLALILMALVLVELGASLPRSGALVRWPQESSGRLVGTLAAWSIWIAYATNPPGEAAAALQYLGHYISWVYVKDQLTFSGKLLGLLLMLGFVLVNWFGVQLFARVTLAFTIGKVVVPLATVAALCLAHFDTSNFTAHGGLAPYGYATALTAITSAGTIFAYTGFQGPLDFSGEAADKHDLPRAVFTALVVSMVLYSALQIAFMGALKSGQLAHGWGLVNMNSPYVDLAAVLNLTWLAWVLRVDAVASPAGSALVYTGEGTRAAYAMGGERYKLLPGAFFSSVNRRGVPQLALVVNFAIGAGFLFLLHDWESIIRVTSVLTLIGYSVSLVSQQAFQRYGGVAMPGLVRGTRVLAPASFAVTALILYWSNWRWFHWMLLVPAAAFVWYCAELCWKRREFDDPKDLLRGLWLPGYLAALAVVSAFGSFGGRGLVRAPYDSVAVAVIALAAYGLALRGARSHLRVNPLPSAPAMPPQGEPAGAE